MKLDSAEHAREHEGSFSVGLEERARHPEAEPKGRFSKGLEQTAAQAEDAPIIGTFAGQTSRIWIKEQWRPDFGGHRSMRR
jgi:hypothetical protein